MTADVASTSPRHELGKVVFSSMFLKRKKSQRFGASSFSKFHHTCRKNPFATPRTVLHRAKEALCNRSQFWTLFLPHRFIKIRPSRQRPVSIEFCWIPEFPGMNPKRKSCRNAWIRRKRTAVQRKSHGHLKKGFGMKVDPNSCERRGACGCLDLYCNVDLDLRRNSYASKSVWIVVQKCTHSLDEVKHWTAYPFRVNIDREKSMG